MIFNSQRLNKSEINNLYNQDLFNIYPVYDGTIKGTYSVSDVISNKFRIYGDSGLVNWMVMGKRFDIEVEKPKNTTNPHQNATQRKKKKKNKQKKKMNNKK